ncbi:hypothetical protein [Kaarinaea lacus]
MPISLFKPFTSSARTSPKGTLITFLTACLMALALSGCATTSDKLDRLERSVRGYEKALRWAKFDMAYSYVKWESGEQPMVPAYLKNIRLTNYSVANNKFDEDSMTASQVVTIYYYNQSDLREKQVEDHQQWKYFDDVDRWLLVSKPPEFK